jgi:antitoxin component YwqK of YwqJK toxin-antitoxin module
LINKSIDMKKTILLMLVSISSSFLFGQAVDMHGVYCDAAGHPYTGIHKEYRADGTIAQELNIENGLLNGEVIFYTADGKVEEKGHYTNGKKSGVWHQFNPGGLLIGEAYYKEGQKDGIWTVWDDQGVKRYHMVYSMGKKVDVWKMWDENAVLVSERMYKE